MNSVQEEIRLFLPHLQAQSVRFHIFSMLWRRAGRNYAQKQLARPGVDKIGGRDLVKDFTPTT